jgi:hypothetical protein
VDEMFVAPHATGEEALARAEAETATKREARRQAEGAMADAEAQLSQAREAFERRVRRRVAEQAAREKAEAEAALLRQENQARRNLGLLARLLAALRGEC